MSTAQEQNHQESPVDEPPVDLSSIITAEFNYIAQTAFQSNEDRARVSTFYLSSAASLIAAIVTSQLLGDASQITSSSASQSVSANVSANVQAIAWAYAFLFGTLSLSGLLTILKLARLRLAWLKSAQAMNHLKQFCVETNGTFETGQIFLWNNDTLPRAASPTSLSSLLALQVIAMSSLMVGTCVYHIGLIFDGAWLYYALASGILALVLLTAVYAVAVAHRPAKDNIMEHAHDWRLAR